MVISTATKIPRVPTEIPEDMGREFSRFLNMVDFTGEIKHYGEGYKPHQSKIDKEVN